MPTHDIVARRPRRRWRRGWICGWAGLLAALAAAGAEAGKETTPMTTLVHETFDAYPNGTAVPPGWWVEGGERVFIEDGRLRVQADARPEALAPDRHNQVCTVWCPQEISGDVRISFQAMVLASETDVRNINLFFFYSEPSGRPLYETRAGRNDGAYSAYHQLNGYIMTFLADHPKAREYHPDGTGKARLRLRRCPGFELVDEARDYHCHIGRAYEVVITRRGGRITVAIDGTVYLDWQDAQPHAAGLVGFRTFQTDLWFDALEITRLSPVEGAE